MLTDEVKVSLGIRHSKLDDEIDNLIEACKLDLKSAGASKAVEVAESDALVKQAVKMYARSWFNYQGNGEKWGEQYETLKHLLCLAEGYREANE